VNESTELHSNGVYTRYHGVELGQVSCGKQTFGCGQCNKGRLY